MDNKPVVTYAGDCKLFTELQQAITQGLPQECVEWRRSYGRPPKPVAVEVNFSRFNEKMLSEEKSNHLLGQPFLHTFWIECSDIEKYKQTVRNEVNDWMACLRMYNVQDWMIVVVEHLDNKKGNKTKLLTRTTVIEKIKNDFPSKNGERCISLLDPFRSDARAATSLNGLLQRLRILLLQAYSTQLSWYEEHVRAQREKRNESGWDFLNFFFLQEELAFVFEMMGVYDDALVQYDELDALFSQFVINSSSGDMPDWLCAYTKSCDNWPGVCLSRDKMPSLRNKMFNRKGSLLDLRSYLFARQCSLLLLLCRPWEMAQRSLPFLHNCVNELHILEIPMQAGAIATWVFLSCLEILQNCERYSDSSQVETYSLYTVELWAYAREKLHELGVMCGLMPNLQASSEQLHMVMILTSGMREDPYDDENPPNRQLRLREALSSQEAFLTQYLEISELTMGTFKHIGRIRSARLIGKDLATLYFSMGQKEKAASFLNDMLKIYYQENWQLLIGQTQLELAFYYKEMEDNAKYTKMCLKIAANHQIDQEERLKYCSEVTASKASLSEGKVLLMKTDRVLLVSNTQITCEDDVVTSESKVEMSLTITNLLPLAIDCSSIKFSLSKDSNTSGDGKHSNIHRTRPRLTRKQALEGKPFMKEPSLDMIGYQESKDDGTVVSKVACHNAHQLLSRRDSHNVGLHHETEIREEDYNLAFVQTAVNLKPGINKLTLQKTGLDTGVYRVTQLCLEWDNVHLLYSYSLPLPSFLLVYEPPAIKLQSLSPSPIAGQIQGYELVVSSGSTMIMEGTEISVKASQGLLLKDKEEEWTSISTFKLPLIKRFHTIKIPFKVLAQFGPQRDAGMVEYRVTLKWTLSSQALTVTLHFLPPFMTAHKLYTCNDKKFLQVVAHGLTNEMFVLEDFTMMYMEDEEEQLLEALNPPSQNLVVNNEQTGLFLWDVSTLKGNPSKYRFVFTMHYRNKTSSGESQIPQKYNYDFRLGDCRTQFTVHAQVEPPNGSEFCRAGSMCHMKIKITKLNLAPSIMIMYEVIADQAMWSICGKTAGVVQLTDENPYSATFDIMPLVGGFLPLPAVRLSKYIPEDQNKAFGKDSITSTVKLEPFDAGLVYSWSRAMQAHVLPATNAIPSEL